MTSSFCPIGIDVSKATFDAGLLPISGRCHPRLRTFANAQAGFEDWLRWTRQQTSDPIQVCLEATGTYHDALVAFLLKQQIRVSVLPSSRLPAFRKSEGKRSKTDEQDALLLALYCQQKQPEPFHLPSDELVELNMLLERVDDVQLQMQQESNRLENSRLNDFVRQQIQQHLKHLKDWHKETLKQALTLVKQHPPCQKAFDLLLNLRGVGHVTALRLLSLLGPDGKRFASPRQLIAFVGLDVVERQSGTSVHGQGHISKQGPARVRKWLALPAQVAMRWDPDMKQWAGELAARGKCFKQIRVAAMRKLLHLAYGVLKHQEAYDRSVAWPGHGTCLQEEQQAA